MKAVIYARYSSERQNEQSIEGQLRECYDYAKTHDISVIGTYIDRALSGKTDNRTEFQRMIRDSESKSFEAIIVYKMDRFSRNRYDSAIYKAKLKKNNVKLLYAKEAIPDGPEGIILESLLEGMAEYYSEELSQKLKRGLRESALKCHATGGYLAYGYKIASDKSFMLDEKEAEVIKTIFKMYDNGNTVKAITEYLSTTGIKTARGGDFSPGAIRRMLQNEKYIGVYQCKDIRIENGVPAVVDKELFNRVQKRFAENRRAPARQKANIDYMLSGKIYCGKCKGGMIGESGRGKTQEKYYYYACANKKSHHTCDKKNVKKDWIENLVVTETVKNILYPERINLIAKRCVEIQQNAINENCELEMLKKQLADIKKSLKNIMTAIEQGIITKTTKERLSELETAKEQIEFKISTLSLPKPKLSEKQIQYMLNQFRTESDVFSDEYKKDIIECFVSSVYLYNEKLIITYNLLGDNNKLTESTLDLINNPDSIKDCEIYKSSDLSALPPP